MTAHGMARRSRPTVYKGVRMRSRLEASFAQFLDDSGVSWAYEPECFADESGQYLPDFKVQLRERTLYVELKPNAVFVDRDAELKRMHPILSTDPAARLDVIVGMEQGRFKIVRTCSESEPCRRCARTPPDAPRERRSGAPPGPAAVRAELARNAGLALPKDAHR